MLYVVHARCTTGVRVYAYVYVINNATAFKFVCYVYTLQEMLYAYYMHNVPVDVIITYVGA